MPVLYEDISVNGATATPSALIPAPFVDISKSYVKTGDGKKIGATYTITLNGTILPDRGSPTAGGALSGDNQVPLFYGERDGSPGTSSAFYSQTVSGDLEQRSLMMKSQAIRRLFSTEGRKLSILTWKSGNPGFYCFPRIKSITMNDGRYSGSVTYTINLECDEIFIDTGTDGSSTTLVGQEDYHNAGVNITQEGGQSFDSDFVSPVGDVSGNVSVYLSSAAETWSTNQGERSVVWYDEGYKNDWTYPESGSETIRFHDVHTYNVTHTISATGKRTYGANGLIREPWENAKIWVESRLGPNPKDSEGESLRPNDYEDPTDTTKFFSKTRNGWDWNSGYFPDNISSDAFFTEWTPHEWSRSGEIDRTSGTYSITETFTMIPGYAKSVGELLNKSVTEDISFDVSYDTMTDVETVSVNGTIKGHNVISNTETSDNVSAIKITAYQNAFKRWKVLSNSSLCVPSDDNPNNKCVPLFRLAKIDFLDQYTESSNPNPISHDPVSSTVQTSQHEGLITFTIVYNNRKDNIGLPAGMPAPLSTSFVVTDQQALKTLVWHEVPGRRTGPIKQDLGTPSMPSRTVSVNVNFHPSTTETEKISAIDKITSKINDFSPGSAIGDGDMAVYFKTADQRENDAVLGVYSRTVTWKYQEET
jgi:hypothetical protein